jgi:Tol biopolymer transport system component
VVFALATGQKHCLTAPVSNNAMDDSLDLSPDGKTVSFVRNTTTGVGDIYVVPLKGGSPRRLTTDGSQTAGTMWAADGKRIIFNSDRGGLLSDRLWQVPSDGGEIEPERVYSHLGALSRDGRRLAYQVDAGGEPGSVWRAELSGPGGHVVASKKVLASVVSESQPQLSPDQSKIAFVSFRSGNYEIWRSDADGGNPLQLTAFGGENAGTPRWSPDGKWIAFDRRPEAHSQIYVVDVDGRNLHAITDGDFDNSVPSWSRDGQSIYFGSMRTGEWQLWKQKPDGGTPVQVTQHGGFTAFESYDGKTLYYTKKDEEGIWSIPMGSGAETRVTSAPRIGSWGHWAVTETGLYLLEDDIVPHPTIEFYDFNSGKLTPVLQLEYSDAPQQPGLDASRDGRTVLFVQFQPQSSLAMVEDFQ